MRLTPFAATKTKSPMFPTPFGLFCATGSGSVATLRRLSKAEIDL